LVEIGHWEVRIATAQPGTSLTYRDGKFLEVIINFGREIGGDNVGKGGGKKGIFIIIECRYVEK
jgi:hypothetical protein